MTTKAYAQALGKFDWIAPASRSDTVFTTGMCSGYPQNPGVKRLKHRKARYMANSKTHQIESRRKAQHLDGYVKE